MRGISCARVNSARSRSPASSCIGSISARPSRPLRRASQASGLSASSTVTRSGVGGPCAAPARGAGRETRSTSAARADAAAPSCCARSWRHRRGKPAAQRAAGAFERSQHRIDRGIVAPVLDQPAGVRRRGAVAAERAADLAEVHAERHVRRDTSRSAAPTRHRASAASRPAIRRPAPRRPPRSQARRRRKAAARSAAAGLVAPARAAGLRADGRDPARLE